MLIGNIGIIAFFTTGFWMLMIFDCIRNEPKSSSWLWILIMANFPGAVTISKYTHSKFFQTVDDERCLVEC
jgi:hypothetical protein